MIKKTIKTHKKYKKSNKKYDIKNQFIIIILKFYMIK
jgi:hypothetical protein